MRIELEEAGARRIGRAHPQENETLPKPVALNLSVVGEGPPLGLVVHVLVDPPSPAGWVIAGRPSMVCSALSRWGPVNRPGGNLSLGFGPLLFGQRMDQCVAFKFPVFGGEHTPSRFPLRSGCAPHRRGRQS